MSDPEDDREILDEIKALEDVLAQDEWSKTSSPDDRKNTAIVNLASRRLNIPSRGFGEVTPHRECEIVPNEIEQPRTAYETNKKLIQLLQESKHELLRILEKCIENKAIVEEKIRITAHNTTSSKIFVGAAGMPYFKDAKQFAATRNRDAVVKAQNGELQCMVRLRITCPWTARDRNILWKAIRQEASTAVLETEENEDSGASSCTENSNPQAPPPAKVLNLPKDFKAMIGPLDAREFDWLKIAATDFDSKHTPDECRVMWRVFLHPEINRYRWTKEEDTRIEQLSRKYRQQDWEALAKELATQRSGYQCFIRYNTNKRSLCFNESPWSEEEDRKLQDCMNKFKIGHYVPWGTVAKYMDGRSKPQVYFRWTYNAAPHLKKGRFTPEEDSILIDAVAKYGKNFCKISECVMQHRSSVQLSDHYHTLVQREHGVRNSWSVSDDANLLKLHQIYGADWSRIAQELPGKNRTQARHRHKAILRYWDKGVSLYDIPREFNRNTEHVASDTTELIERLELDKIQQNAAKHSAKLQQIDLELLKFFELMPPAAKPGRKQKYYKAEELDRATRKLYSLLRNLKVNLAVPEQLDLKVLTDKDKQLLKSLKDYMQIPYKYVIQRPLTTAAESARLNESGMDDNDGGIHFAPLCSGNCNRKEVMILLGSIDYQPPQNYDHALIKLDMEFDTPTIVDEFVGEEDNLQFKRLMRIFETRQTNARGRNFVEKIYVLPPEEYSTILSTAEIKTLSRGVRSQRASDDATKKKKECAIREFEDQFHRSCIEPNHYTLLGLQHIIAKQKTAKNPALSTSRQVLPTSEKGLRSLEILKRRLVQLFKYPIGLSNIVRPELYVENLKSTATSDENDANVGRDSDSSSATISSSTAKRKRITESRQEKATVSEKTAKRKKR